jgi:SAM-dependent methyltransferase
MIEGGVVVGNVQGKYLTRNPLYRSLVGGFFRTAEELLRGVGAASVLEMGCGEGYAADRLRPAVGRSRVTGVDLSLPMLAQARRNYPSLSFCVGTAYQLPFPRTTFDLVLAMEVLEHLDAPEKALAEVQRVGRGLVLASVPREPIWRALNMARFAYWSSWGNTPGHLNHWSKGDFVRLLKRHFRVLEVRSPFPWTMALCSI